MCWLNPEPDAPYECIVCHEERLLHSSTCTKVDELVGNFQSFSVLTTLPETTRHVFNKLLKHELSLGPPQPEFHVDPDSGIGSEPSHDVQDAMEEEEEVEISKFSGRPIITNKRSLVHDWSDEENEDELHHSRQRRRVDDSSDDDDWDNMTQSSVSEMDTAVRGRNVPRSEEQLGLNTIRNVLEDEAEEHFCQTLNERIDSYLGEREATPAPELLLNETSEDAKLRKLAVQRLLRFLDVLDMFTPWFAPVQFKENQELLMLMVATHLKLIVGKEAFKKSSTLLYQILSTDPELMRKKNLIWITSRQQGKTSTLAKFLAVLSYLSPTGGNLAFVYSTTRDKAQDLMDAARKYLYWAAENQEIIAKLAEYGLEPPRFKKNNAITYVLYSATNSTALNIVRARPKNVTYCRGDAPETVIIDEFCFVEKAFWDDFAVPLTGVKDRTFIMASTPAQIGSFADDFIKTTIEKNLKGNVFMYLINHALICKQCIEDGVARECSHRLYLIPPWKSLFGIDQMGEFVTLKDRENYEKEMFGIIAREGSTFFKPAYIHKVFDPLNMRRMKDLPEKIVVYVNIDPPSHERCNMGMSSHLFTKTGQVFILGIAEVAMDQTQTQEMEKLAATFVTQIIAQLSYENKSPSQITVVPIVECVNNDFVAGGISKAIRLYSQQYGCKSFNAPKRKFFNESISEDVGFWTDKKTKPGYIQNMISMFVDNRLAVWKRCTTIGSVFAKNYTTPSTHVMLDILCSQFRQWKNTPKGPTGNSAATYDDMSISLMMGLYWSHMLRITLSLQSKAKKHESNPGIKDNIELPFARMRAMNLPHARLQKRKRVKKMYDDAMARSFALKKNRTKHRRVKLRA